MKKFIYLLLLFFPFIVSALDDDILIKNVELISKSDNTIELEEPSYNGLDIYFNLKFFELNDAAKYKIVIANNGSDIYEINDIIETFSQEDYVDYVFDYDSESDNLFDPGEEIILYITVTYAREVQDEDYENNLYTNKNYMSFDFSISNDDVDNPNTNNGYLVVVIVITVLVLVFLVFMFRKKKKLYGIIFLIIFVPIIIRALNLYKTEINVYVEIEREVLGTFTLCGAEYSFESGMTINDWLNSEYNVDGYYIETNSWWGNYNISSPVIPDSPGIFYYTYLDLELEIAAGDTYSCYSRAVAECVSPDSEILVGLDGETKLAKEMQNGDEVVYYDFEDNELKIGEVKKVYIHENATDFIRYIFADGTYLEATDYHPIYTMNGWKSYTNRNGYEKPVIGDMVKTSTGWKLLKEIETYNGDEDFYDFKIVSSDGEIIDNYFANGILVHSAY